MDGLPENDRTDGPVDEGLLATAAVSEPPQLLPELLAVLRRHWGFDALRPLQREAIQAGLDGRDSLVVMPTGGGKSLCYQLPPVIAGRMDVVVSPLVALMKDQVDGLRAIDYPAASMNSAMSDDERRDARDMVRRGECRLLFVSPERLVAPGFLDFLADSGVRSFAVDEAHCISHWGHDFRPEYRQLAILRDRFPDAALHAFTATATPRVRDDIVAQLGLRNPAVLVGDFDRPNLVYRILPRVGTREQVRGILARHINEAAIVYCITRRETEELARYLRESGVNAEHYHAGMDPAERRASQERFASERTDVIVATVAFGMGIDRSNVRCVVHAGLPRSVEAYQQESGRAGRDGLPAECVLLYSYADVARWEDLIARSTDDASMADPDRELDLARHRDVQLGHLHELSRLCSGARCRHAALCEHFGQTWMRGPCNACDVCLGEIDAVADSTLVARKILSAVARTEQRFGAAHIAKVLVGSADEAVRRNGHDTLTVHGLLRDRSHGAVVNLVHQLADHGLLVRNPGEFPTLALSERGVELMRGDGEVTLREPRQPKSKRRATAIEAESWEGVDRGVFERLRMLRRTLANEQGVPAYVVFDDATLRELARHRPATLDQMSQIRGIGKKKLDAYGEAVLGEIAAEAGSSGDDP